MPLDYDRKDKRSFLEQIQCVNRHLTGLLVGLLARDASAIVPPTDPNSLPVSPLLDIMYLLGRKTGL